MSDDVAQEYLEQRYEHYLDTEGLSPKDAYIEALQDAEMLVCDLSESWKEETNE
tara:strand:- start:169 stop:330 length:162 start_codon:yes stop_codon:yes gene_type:complete